MKTHDASDYCVVLTTCSSEAELELIAAALLDRRLAACVQAIDIKSFYVWKGERQAEPEKLLLIKTRRDLYGQIEATLKDVHPYETPEILSLPVAAGFAGYLSWIDASTAAVATSAEESG